MRIFSLCVETEEIDSCGDYVIGTQFILDSGNIEVVFEGIRNLLKEDKDWVFKIVRYAEEED